MSLGWRGLGPGTGGRAETDRQRCQHQQLRANRFERLIHVTLPVLSPVIFFNLVMAIIGTFSILTVPYIMTQGGPNNATYFYTMYSFDSGFTFLRMGYASALAWVQFLIVLFLTGIAFWSARKWVHYA